MTITLNYNQYLDLMTTLGELQGMVKGLLSYPNIPKEVQTTLTVRLRTIQMQTDLLHNSFKEYSGHSPFQKLGVEELIPL